MITSQADYVRHSPHIHHKTYCNCFRLINPTSTLKHIFNSKTQDNPFYIFQHIMMSLKILWSTIFNSGLFIRISLYMKKLHFNLVAKIYHIVYLRFYSIILLNVFNNFFYKVLVILWYVAEMRNFRRIFYWNTLL